MILDAAKFSLFIRELYGYSPFPWQVRLLTQVLNTGSWPKTLDLPTGSGKTSAMDIAVYWIAADQSGVAPRRVLAIVDRRVIVDQTHEHAQQLAERLAEAVEGTVVHAVAQALLAKTGGCGEPLKTTILRGGMVRDDSWADAPDQPLVVCSTVDQVGSRLLFRGYGVSSRMSPIHAGLVGMDCLYLLDEVHLSRPFYETLEAIQQYYRDSVLPSRWQVVAMSATSGESGERFQLDDEDREHPQLRQRLQASRPAVLELLSCSSSPTAIRTATAASAVRHAKAMLKEGYQAIGIIVNRVDTARRIHAALSGRVKANVGLLTGRMRPIDKGIVAPLVHALRAGRQDELDEPIVLVSTQCIEAGADLDFDAMVTACASLDALRQRFGRLNRLGERPTARAVILCPPIKGPDPVYGEALGHTREFLISLEELGELDFNLTTMGERFAALEEPAKVLSPTVNAPILLPGLFDLWVQTHPRPYPDPEVSPWLHGPNRGMPEVQVVWRSDLTVDALEEADGEEAGQRVARTWKKKAKDTNVAPVTAKAAALALKGLIYQLEACPPASQEALSVPLYAAQAWLSKVAFTEVADVSLEGDSPKKGKDSDGLRALRWSGTDSVVVHADDLQPGDTLIVPVTYGGLRQNVGVWDPAAQDSVDDRGDEVQWLQRGRAVLRPQLYSALRGVVSNNQEDDFDLHSAVIEGLHSLEGESGWLGEVARHLLKGWIWVKLSEHDGVVVGRKRRSAIDFVPGQNTGSFIGCPVTLSQHLSDVESWARVFVSGLTLPEGIAADVVLAASLHDLGKAEPRFQQILAGGDPVQAALLREPLAKSGMVSQDQDQRAQIQALSGYPRGTRHELMSVALIEDSIWKERANDWDLVLHLVGSHHGWCRPFAPPVADPDAVSVSVQYGGESLTLRSDHGLAKLGSGVVDRFWLLTERYGAHGLAWLESIVRLADHRGSARGGVE